MRILGFAREEVGSDLGDGIFSGMHEVEEALEEEKSNSRTREQVPGVWKCTVAERLGRRYRER